MATSWQDWAIGWWYLVVTSLFLYIVQVRGPRLLWLDKTFLWRQLDVVTVLFDLGQPGMNKSDNKTECTTLFKFKQVFILKARWISEILTANESSPRQPVEMHSHLKTCPVTSLPPSRPASVAHLISMIWDYLHNSLFLSPRPDQEPTNGFLFLTNWVQLVLLCPLYKI